MDPTIVVSLVSVIGVAATAIATYLGTRTKARADAEAAAAAKIPEMQRVWIEGTRDLFRFQNEVSAGLRAELAELKTAFAKMRAEIDGLEDYVAILTQALQAANIPVPPRPLRP